MGRHTTYWGYLSQVDTPNGEYWVATLRGIARFNPRPGPKAPMFTVYRPDQEGLGQQVNALIEDRQGVIWVGTNNGVGQLVQTSGRWELRRTDVGLPPYCAAEAFLEDHEGNLWIALYPRALNGARLCRRVPAGRVSFFEDDFLRGNRILAMKELQGRIWLGTYHGLAILAFRPERGGRVTEQVYGKRDGLAGELDILKSETWCK